MKKHKYSMHLGTVGVRNFSDILTENAREIVQEIAVRAELGFECKLYHRPSYAAEPAWSKKLDQFFEVNGSIKSSSTAAALIFKCEERYMACTFGHGHALLDGDKCENDFGLLVAANSLSDENVKLVEKANLGSVIRDATQAAGITRLQEFNVDRALSLVRKLSGYAKDGGGALSGASSISITSEKEIDELLELGQSLLKLYNSDSYRKSGFGIIDKIKPVLSLSLQNDLDALLLSDLALESPSFELGAPEIDTQPIGFMTISGTGRRTQFPDISLSTFLNEVEALESTEDLHKHRIVTHSIDGSHRLKEWTLHKGLIGSLIHNSERYALNEGKWYRIDQAVQQSANSAFESSSTGLDKSFLPWPIVAAGKKGKTDTYIREEHYIERLCGTSPDRYILFDQNLIPIPNNPGRGIEICDIFDIEEQRLIHVKRSGRRSSIISHFLMQGMNSAKLLRTYDQINDAFFVALKNKTSEEKYGELVSGFPRDWKVEYKFGDIPNSSGEYTIPFFSRVTLDEVRREIRALGFKDVQVSFVRLSTPSKKQK